MVKKKDQNMYRVVWFVLIFLAIFGGVVLVEKLNPANSPVQRTVAPTPSSSFDFANMTVPVYGNGMKFTNGSYSNSDGETAQITNESLSRSGFRGAAILVDSPGGSGTFFSVIGAMNSGGEITYTSPQPLGDRIKIVSVTVEDPSTHDNGEVIVEYLTRPENAPMSDTPTVKATKKYSFEDNGNLIEVLH